MPLAILGTSHTPNLMKALGLILNLLMIHRVYYLAVERHI